MGARPRKPDAAPALHNAHPRIKELPPVKNLKKPILILRDWVELYIPIISFIIMFVVFLLQIFCRYVMRSPLQWAYEVTVTCYLWLVVLGACYAQREHAHVMFTLIYDKMPTRMKAFTAFLGNFLMLFAFAWSFLPSVKFIDFMKMQKTSILKIGLNIVYAPYIPFLILMMIYIAIDMYHEFRVFTGIASKAETAKLLNESLTEAEEAVLAARKGEKA